MATIYGKELVRYALKIGALELIPQGRKLKSGRISPYFFNTGLFKTGEALSQLSRAYASALSRVNFDVLFGLAYKGIPLAAAVAVSLYEHFCFYNVGYAYNRKEEKDHGEGGILVGDSLKDREVCIIDDVITSGSTADEAIETVKKHGGKPYYYTIAFDRFERTTDESFEAASNEFGRKYGIMVISAATVIDLTVVLQEDQQKHPLYQEILPKILRYREQYGPR